MIALAALSGAGFGAGVWLLITGLREREPLPKLTWSWPRDAVTVRAALAVVGFLVGVLATGWPVAGVLGGALGAALPSVVGQRARRDAELAKIEAIASWAEMLRDTVSAGSGLHEAIRATAPVAPAAIRDAVAGLALRQDRGGIVGALRWFADEVADPTADLIVAALTIAATEQAKRPADLLATLATATRDQAAMRLRIEAGRARTRTVANSIAAIAAVSAVGFLAFDRSYLRPYDTAVGQLVLAVVGGCFTLSFILLVRMGAITAPPRLLLRAPEEHP